MVKKAVTCHNWDAFPDLGEAGLRTADKGCFGSYMKPYNLILLSMILQLE